jgi:hypothetical protein
MLRVRLIHAPGRRAPGGCDSQVGRGAAEEGGARPPRLTRSRIGSVEYREGRGAARRRRARNPGSEAATGASATVYLLHNGPAS